MLFSCFKRLCSISITFARDKLKAICPRLARASSLRPPKGVQDPFFHLLTRTEMDLSSAGTDGTRLSPRAEKNSTAMIAGPWFSGKDKIVIDSIDPTWYGLEDGAGHWLKDSHGISVYDPVRQIVKIVTQFPNKRNTRPILGLASIWSGTTVSDLLKSSILKLTLRYFACKTCKEKWHGWLLPLKVSRLFDCFAKRIENHSTELKRQLAMVAMQQMSTIYIYIYNPPWKKLYRIHNLGVRFYRDEAGRPVFTIEWYLDCAHPVYIPKSETKLKALQTQFSTL